MNRHDLFNFEPKRLRRNAAFFTLLAIVSSIFSASAYVIVTAWVLFAVSIFGVLFGDRYSR